MFFMKKYNKILITFLILTLPFLPLFLFYYFTYLFMSSDYKNHNRNEKNKYDLIYKNNGKFVFYNNDKYSEYKYCKINDINKENCRFLSKKDFLNLTSQSIKEETLSNSQNNKDTISYRKGDLNFYENSKFKNYKYCYNNDVKMENCVYLEEDEFNELY